MLNGHTIRKKTCYMYADALVLGSDQFDFALKCHHEGARSKRSEEEEEA